MRSAGWRPSSRPGGTPRSTPSAFAKVRADKTREADAGYEGSWVAHPDLVPICREIFDAALGERVNQLDKVLPRCPMSTAKDLLDIRSLPLTVTAKGLRDNIEVALEYIVNWLAGNGAVGINNLMEDAATAEISRCQVWQWRRNRVVLDNGRQVTAELIIGLLDQATETLADTLGRDSRAERNCWPTPGTCCSTCARKDRFVDFLTLPAYELLP